MPTQTPLALLIRLACISLVGASCAAAARSTPSATMPVVSISAHAEEEPVTRPGMLGAAGAADIPFASAGFTAAAIADQGAASLGEVLARDPAIRATGQGGGILESFQIRGFPIGEGNLGEVAFDGQYGIAPNFRVLTEYVERIDVLKGPAALLYGMSPNSGIGGVINIVPKRAGARDLTRVIVDHGADSLWGAHVDAGRRFGPGRAVGLRLNASRRSGGTPIDAQERQASVGAAAFDYQGERLRVTLDLLGQRERFDAPSRPFVVGAGVAVPEAPPGERNVTQAWEYAQLEDRSALLRAEYDAGAGITLFAGAGGGKSEVERLFGTPTILNGAGATSTLPARFGFDIERASQEAGVRARFRAAGIQHTLTVQASRYRDSLRRGSVNGTAYRSNMYAPLAQPAQAVAAPARLALISETALDGAALADSMSLLDGRLLVTVGARRQAIQGDNFNPANGVLTSRYDDSAVTTLAGAVFKLAPQLALYANSVEGLSRGDIAPPNAANAGEAFAPYRARQHEAGVRFDHGSLQATLSAFQVKKPSGELAGTVYRVSGEQRNRGLELSVAGRPAPALRVLGGASWTDAELSATINPATLGKRAVGVARAQGNLGVEWQAAANLALNAHLAHTGRQFVDAANTRSLPAWSRIDLGLRHALQAGAIPLVLRASVNNAADRAYWAGVATWGGFVQGAPRTLALSLSADL